MRIWHKSLIPYLPREQLIAQWRECSAIAGSIIKNGTPNHILVNKILDYPIEEFIMYSILVRKEMSARGYKTMQSVMDKILSLNPQFDGDVPRPLFKDWHNHRYLMQCFANLQEKYDCGGIKEEDWKKVEDYVLKNVFEVSIKDVKRGSYTITI